MTRRSLVVFFLLTLFSGGTLAQSTGIFRHIGIGRSGATKIFLGASMDDIAAAIDSEGDEYTVRSGTFGGAQKIFLTFSSQRRLSSMKFVYASGTDFEEKRSSYTKTLGTPQGQSELITKSLSVFVVFWEDKSTRFELVKKIEGKQMSVTSSLFDMTN